MPVTYDKPISLQSKDVPYRYEERDTLLYAVSDEPALSAGLHG